MKIYKITNLINNKIYIGQTNGKNPYYKGGGNILKLAYKKYGKINFKMETIIEGNFNKLILDRLEEYYINSYNSTNSEIGYNIAKGATIKGIKMSKNTSNKIRIANIGNKNASGKRSNITKLKMRMSKLGTKQSEEHIKNIKLAKIKNKENKSYKYIPKLYKRKSIICLNINTNEKIIFESLMEASRNLNIGRTSIGNNLKGLSLLVNKQYKFIYNA